MNDLERAEQKEDIDAVNRRRKMANEAHRIADETTDMDIEEIEFERNRMEELYGNKYPFRWNLAIVAGFVGGLLGSMIAVFLYSSSDIVYIQTGSGTYSQEDSVRNQSIKIYAIGLLCGMCGGAALAIGVMSILTIRHYLNDPFQEHVRTMREIVRRKEQERIEKHEEHIYYDAEQSQSCCFKFCCCPHYGKITSERVIYSAVPDSMRCCCGLCSLPACFNRKVESLDIEHVLDVGVRQSCRDALFSDTGDVLLHIVGGADVSIMKDERDKLLTILGKKYDRGDEDDCKQRIIDLKTALHTASRIKGLKPLVTRAEKEVRMLVSEGEARHRDKGVPYQEPVPQTLASLSDVQMNSTTNIIVKDVYKPFLVMDSLSYRIAKATDFGGDKASKAESIMKSLYGEPSHVMGAEKEDFEGLLPGAIVTVPSDVAPAASSKERSPRTSQKRVVKKEKKEKRTTEASGKTGYSMEDEASESRCARDAE